MRDSIAIRVRFARGMGSTTIGASPDAIRRTIEAFCETSRRFHITESSPGVVRVTAGANWRTWGEAIRIDLEEEPGARTRVTATIEPRLATALFDFGQARSTLRTLLDAAGKGLE